MGALIFKNRPAIVASACCVGRKEKQGPLGGYFDDFDDDTTFGEKTWEKSETALQLRTMNSAIERAGMAFSDIDMIFGGDLQAQCTATAYSVRAAARPFMGLYGACSTMALSLIAAATYVDAGFAKSAAAITSSHFCSAERQFRFPLEYGSQRCPTAQWTVTGGGCCILGSGEGPRLAAATLGRIVDLGVTDINNMGAAMAPAAADTIEKHLRETASAPADYDAIITGDLGAVGSEILVTMLKQRGIVLNNHLDCGCMIYGDDDKNGAGGSGCGCSASVLCDYFLPKIKAGEMSKLLFCATGALMSTATFQQGESIPAVAHLVNIVK